MKLPTISKATSKMLAHLSRHVFVNSHHNVSTFEDVAAKDTYCSTHPCQRSWKIAFAVILFLESVLFGYIALLLRHYSCLSSKGFRKLLHIVNVFGGGVFLATGLLHILPEAVEFLTPTSMFHHHLQFPTAFAIVLSIYFVFLFFDRVLKEHSSSLVSTLQKTADDLDDFSSGYPEDPEEYDDAWTDQCDFRSAQSSDAEDPLAVVVDDMHDFKSPEFANAAVMVLGMAAHSLLESVALGGTARMSVVLNTFIAISAHRWATSMALGARFAKKRLGTVPYTALNIAFALVAPFGVFIGLIVQQTSRVFQGVIFSMSAATFLYIGAFETPTEEFVTHRRWPVLKFFFMLGGATMIVVVTAIVVAVSIH